MCGRIFFIKISTMSKIDDDRDDDVHNLRYRGSEKHQHDTLPFSAIRNPNEIEHEHALVGENGNKHFNSSKSRIHDIFDKDSRYFASSELYVATKADSSELQHEAEDTVDTELEDPLELLAKELPEDPHHLSFKKQISNKSIKAPTAIPSIYKGTTLLSYLYSELTRGYLLEHDEARFSEKRQRVYTFIRIPWELEKFMTYGFFQCLDTFLFVYTFLPVRVALAMLQLIGRCLTGRGWCVGGRLLEPAQLCDLMKGLVLVASIILLQYVDVSVLYHMIRGQAIIKLYIFFNMLEVADRLFSSFGQDILDSLFWTMTEPHERRRETIGVLPHFLMAVAYVSLHAVLVLFQATTLNVAFNSHNKALLTIMMSNNFVELKGNVFKKFEKNNLFQMSCSDVRERFHFVVLLTFVCVRNLTEFSWNLDHLWDLVPDIVMVMSAEILVDWIKHCFITKFNEIPHDVYSDYVTSIAYDMVSARHSQSHSDHMDLVSRRMGFIPLPLAVVVTRVIWQSLTPSSYLVPLLWIVFYLCLVTFKVTNGIILLGKACNLTRENKQRSHPSSASSSIAPFLSPLKRNQSDPMLNTASKPDSSMENSPEIVTSGETANVNSKASCLKRSQSLGCKLNVTFSDGCMAETYNEAGILTTSRKAEDTFGYLSPSESGAITPNIILTNSSVSLQSVSLNEEFLRDSVKLAELSSAANTASTKISPGESHLSGNGLKGSEEGDLTLQNVDRYTMVSNRIVP